ncbi:hypothetical protein Pst134EA_007329, partial [Puccinia striiformis f. sp. tritici]|uniref:hypothetical protein n=1 Tax=Puccinia striiformis f. sp. tritici TaxID=168172 RepID=UPI0020085ADD
MDEGTRCEIYEWALNPKIVEMVITRGGWAEVKTLKEKEDLVIVAALAVQSRPALSPGVPMEIDNLGLESHFRFADWRAMCKERSICHHCGNAFDKKHVDAKGCTKTQGNQLKTADKVRIWKEWLGKDEARLAEVTARVQKVQQPIQAPVHVDNVTVESMSMADFFLNRAIEEGMDLEE